MKKVLVALYILSLLISGSHAVVRIMPLGDSITYDGAYSDHQGASRPASQRHGYRNHLWYRLVDAGFSVDFVGSRVAGTAIVPPFDPENEGYPGETSDFIGNHVYRFLTQNPADIILLHIGTNNRLRIDSSGNHVAGIHKIFNEIDRYERNYHRHVKVIVALIIGRRNNDFADFTNTYNRNLRNSTNGRIAQGDDLLLVDMQHGAGLNYSSDFQDPAHPTDNGYKKIANVWFNALSPLLNSVIQPPNGVQMTFISGGTVILRWQNDDSPKDGYKVYRGDTLIATLPVETTGYTPQGLSVGNTYTFSIVSYQGNISSSPYTFTFKMTDDYGWLPAIYTVSLFQ